MTNLKTSGSSSSVENFVKAIYHQQQGTSPDGRPGTLARRLKISNAAATDMARKLAAKNLVNYTKYKELTLTPAGRQLALNVVRKHRLWESFLFRTLGLSLHEIHREAEQLEHLTSDFLADKISAYLGHPDLDPHGDPIPGQDGKIPVEQGQMPLAEAPPEQDYTVCRLLGSEEDFLSFCTTHQIIVGKSIKVKKQHSSRLTEIDVSGNTLLLHHDFTSKISIRKKI